MRELALDHAAGRIADAAYLARSGVLREELSTIADEAGGRVGAERAVEWLRALSRTWSLTGVAQERADLLHAIYERIVVAGRTIVFVRLTPAAQQHGLALALPEVVMAPPTMAPPAGIEPATVCLEGSCSIR